jgi:putative acetyltransferase
MKSIEGNFNNLQVDELLKKHFIELRSVSPADSCHVLDIKGLKNSTIKFWSLWENEQLIGCGALKFLEEGHGELKSIRVAESFRKKGYGIKVIKPRLLLYELTNRSLLDLNLIN